MEDERPLGRPRMQRLGSWSSLQAPVGTGYWPSIVRLLLGSLMILRLAELNIAMAAINYPAILASATFWFFTFLCVAAGLFTRPALLLASALCLGSYYTGTFKIELPGFMWMAFTNAASYGEPTNIYFIGLILLLLAFTPCADYFSLDKRRGRVKPAGPSPQWAVQLVVFQLSAMYFWAAVVKLNPTFLSGAALESAWILSVAGSLFYSHSADHKLLFQTFGIIVIASEFLLAFLFFFPRTRKFGILFGLIFHGLAMMVFPVRYYSFSAAIVYLLLLDSPKDERRI